MWPEKAKIHLTSLDVSSIDVYDSSVLFNGQKRNTFIFYMYIQVYFHSSLKVNVNDSQLTNINMLLFLRKGHRSNFRCM